MKQMHASRWTRLLRNRLGQRHLLRLRLEQLESRYLLAVDSGLASEAPEIPPPITWFESFDEVPRISFESLHAVDKHYPDGFQGPRELAAGEWIVQLSESAARLVGALDAAEEHLDDDFNNFTIIAGLGAEGLMLVRGEGVTAADVEASLAGNNAVESFSLNSVITGQATTPNDSDYLGNLLPGLNQIEAAGAWEQSIGSMSTVVGVVDGGIDAAHPDLYLNIWLNQGEIPSTLKSQLTDLDDDGLITFYDLNNLKRVSEGLVVASTGAIATEEQLTTATPYASGLNAEFVEDKNGNGRIDAIDLLDDVTWADGRDTDSNSFFDDFFGVNFRSGGSDPFQSNRPLDPLGHGTHVAGTIGAIGDNGIGVVGVNWQTSLMSLRILDGNNQTDSAAAVRALNYARQMRDAFERDEAGRTTKGANLRVLNNSWGQPGGYQSLFENVIEELGDAGILFVAAAGNGNFIGNGVDNDSTPFYPASYNLDNVIAVAALSSSGDRLANFSNYGATSVDIAAPGVGVRSTIPGGGYGSSNGTSMAAPHVAGAAALIWSTLPDVPVNEMVASLITAVNTSPSLFSKTLSAGALDAAASIDSDIFVPTARMLPNPNITTRGTEKFEFTVIYEHRSGIDLTTIGDDDLDVLRDWGSNELASVSYMEGTAVANGRFATATYEVAAPGGEWDPLDYGQYEILTKDTNVESSNGTPIERRSIGSFRVRIDEPSVFYVDTFEDDGSSRSLRGAVASANAIAPTPAIIILNEGNYGLSLVDVPDPNSPFSTVSSESGCMAESNASLWSNAETGDLDITGNVSIVGNLTQSTVVSADSENRLFKIAPSGSLNLQRLTLTGGRSNAGQGGGAVLSMGNVSIDKVAVTDNLAEKGDEAVGGGGIASWGGSVTVSDSTLSGNQADVGSAIFACNHAIVTIQRSSIDHNRSRREDGGAIYALTSAEAVVENTTISANENGAIRSSIDDSLFGTDLPFINLETAGSIGDKVVFVSGADSFTEGDSEGVQNVYVFDQTSGRIERITANIDGFDTAVKAGSNAYTSSNGRYAVFDILNQPELGTGIAVYDIQTGDLDVTPYRGGGSARFVSNDGRWIAFRQYSAVPGDTNGFEDLYIYDRSADQIAIGEVPISGDETGYSINPVAISGNGSTIAFIRQPRIGTSVENGALYIVSNDGVSPRRVAENINTNQVTAGALSDDGTKLVFQTSEALVAEDTNVTSDIYLFDVSLENFSLLSATPTGVQGYADSAIISGSGDFVSFRSSSSVFDPNDQPNTNDIFIRDMATGTIDRIPLEGNLLSERPWSSSQLAPKSFGPDGSFFVRAPAEFIDMPYPHSYFFTNLATADFESVLPVWSGGTTKVRNVTVADNTGNEIVHGPVQIRNSIFSGNQSLRPAVDPTELGSKSASLGYNVFEWSLSSSEPSDITVSESRELLGPLQRLNSVTKFHALRMGHPAIDSGNKDDSPSFDQRGIMRPAQTDDSLPDRGAVEQDYGVLNGKVFLDKNSNQVLDAGEPGIADIELVTQRESINPTESFFTEQFSAVDNPETTNVSELGDFFFASIPTGKSIVSVSLPENFVASMAPTDRIMNPTVENELPLYSPDLSASGRFIAFQSAASNLVPNDTNRPPGFPVTSTTGTDVFVFDRLGRSIELITLSRHGTFATGGNDPVIDESGRLVAFVSASGELVSGPKTCQYCIHLKDRVTGTTERIGSDLFGSVGPPNISSDGNFIVFGGSITEGVTDLLLYTRETGEIQRINQTADGTRFDVQSGYRHSISANGRYVTVMAQASIPGTEPQMQVAPLYLLDRDTQTFDFIASNGVDARQIAMSDNGRFVAWSTQHIFRSQLMLYDSWTGTTHAISNGIDGEQGNGNSYGASLSGDGRFVLFESSASNLVEGDSNAIPDWFIYDTNTTELRKVVSSGTDPRSISSQSAGAITPNGKFIAFESDASDLVAGDTRAMGDIFIQENPFLQGVVPIDLRKGELVKMNIGILPQSGTVSGRLFEDSIANGLYDAGEPVFRDHVVYVDDNGNGVRDPAEQFVFTNAGGMYTFPDLPSVETYVIAAAPKVDYAQVAPRIDDEMHWNVFLPAGGQIGGRDFAFRPVAGTAQSTSSSVSGRMYTDVNGNGVFDDGIDVPTSNAVVYLDSANFGTRDENEPAVETNAAGQYMIPNLGASVVSVATLLDEDLSHVSPLGNEFSRSTSPLHSSVQPFGNPQSIITGDFNGDDYPDVAVALGEANKISIRLNDKQGAFLPNEIDIDLGIDGGGPTSLAVGQFNGAGTPLDVAVVNNFTGKVIVLTDFNDAGFDSMSVLAVGVEPLDLTTAQITGDSNHLDLIVVNKADNTIQALLNNGSGGFVAGPPIPTGGIDAVSIVAAELTGDANVDIAVAHASSSVVGTPFGDIRVLAGNGAGAFALTATRYTVGALPYDLVAANFDDDAAGRVDLAVNNFGSNSISILTGNSDGTLTVQPQTLGTASGALDIAAGDLDNDGDIDLVAGNLRDRNLSIFRNISVASGTTTFQPLESFGLGQFALAQRMPLAIANFDQDRSAPGGAGTLDIISIPSLSEVLHVLTNSLVDGAHRVELTGLNQISDLDFVVQSLIIAPTLDPVSGPVVMSEDETYTVKLSGISKGREDSADLKITAFSSQPEIIPDQAVSLVPGATETSFVLAPVLNANTGAPPNETPITITVEARNAGPGASAIFGDEDDGVLLRSFTVTVQPVNDPPEFLLQSLVSVTQKVGPRTMPAFATNMSPGGGNDENGQLHSDFLVVADNPNLFLAAPMIDRQGQLTFTPDPNRAGITLVTVSLSDDGLREHGGSDTTTKVFAINIAPVNDPPSINLGDDLIVSNKAGAQTVAGFASGFSPGSGDDDALQNLADFIVTVDRSDLFSVVPDISNDGTLTFTPSVSANGTATVTVQVRDDGGRGNGGDDLSAEQQFTIRIGATPTVESVLINDGSSSGRSQVTSLTVVFESEVDHAGLGDAFTLTNIDSGIEVGALAVAPVNSNGKTFATITFSGTSTIARAGGNSLADGNYRLDIAASKITNLGGALAMAGDYQFGGKPADEPNNDDFFRLFGDSDGDGDVDGQDYGRFGLTFLKQAFDPNYNADLDYDGDGDVDGQDYGQFGKRFLTRRN